MVSSDRRRGGILGGLLITGLVLVGLAVVAAVYLAKNVRVVEGNRGDSVSIQTPAGNLNIRGHEKITPDMTGFPVYPGATTRKEAGGASFEWNSADGKNDKGFSVAGQELFTTDPLSKVTAFYQAQLPHWMVTTERDGTTKFELKEGGYRRIIAIREKSDGTHIGVATIGTPASN